MADQDNITECNSCGGKLADLDDYILWHSIRAALSAAPVAAVICGIWAPVFFLVRLGIGGALGEAGAGILAGLVLKKIGVGVIIGILLGAAIGIGRDDLGLFLGAVIGALGGFFIAAADVMPLKSDAAHRLDIVLVSVIAGILCVITVYLANGHIKRRFGDWIGPEPRLDVEQADEGQVGN